MAALGPTLASSSVNDANLPWIALTLALVAGLAVYWWWQHYRAGRADGQALTRARQLVFLLVTVPRQQRAGDAPERDYRKLLAVAEPLYAALAGLVAARQSAATGDQPVFSLEIVAKNKEIFFYVGGESSYINLLERQLHGQYPAAHLERSTEFKIFDERDLPFDAAQLTLTRPFVYPLKTYRHLESDPLNALTTALSKLEDEARGAIQLLVRPVGVAWQRRVEQAMKQIGEGKKVEGDKTAWQTAGRLAKEVIGQAAGQNNPTNEAAVKPEQQAQLELLREKAGKQALEVQLRCLVTAEQPELARVYLNTLLAAFGQFNSPDRNALVATAETAPEVARDYVLRRFRGGGMILTTEELASLFHLPNQFTDTPNIHWLSARRLAPPVNLPTEGLKIGESEYRGVTRAINILPDDRLRHVYLIGKTGVGKTVLFENMIEQDIRAGHGVAYFDPNGDAIEWILGRIHKERAEDVIYFNPADQARPFGLNLLEWKRPEERDFLVQEALSIFYKLFDPNSVGIVGPQFEHWFRNAALTLMADPEGGTLVEIPRLFVDQDFERAKVANVTDPVVRAFWEKQLSQTTAASKSEMLNYFISKFGRFMTNDMIRNIIGQPESSFDFRSVMDERKILLVNLSKGLIGELNSQLLGMILTAKLQMAAFSRQDIAEPARIPFYLYVDEFQNFTTDTFAVILSEARKYKLGLNITNQYLAQLTPAIRDAVLGNVGTLMAFRVGAADTELLLKEFEGVTLDDLVNTEKQHFYIKTLIDNAPTGTFTGRSSGWTPDGHVELAAAIKELSRLKHGRDGVAVNAAILRRSRVDSLPLPTTRDPQPVTNPL